MTDQPEGRERRGGGFRPFADLCRAATMAAYRNAENNALRRRDKALAERMRQARIGIARKYGLDPDG